MRLIATVALEPDALVLTYMTLPADLRENGLAAQHQLTIPKGSDYDDEIEAVTDAVHALLADALDDFSKVPEYVPPEEEGDDDALD